MQYINFVARTIVTVLTLSNFWCFILLSSSVANDSLLVLVLVGGGMMAMDGDLEIVQW